MAKFEEIEGLPRKAFAEKLAREYSDGWSRDGLAKRHHISNFLVRTLLLEVGTTFRKKGRQPVIRKGAQ